MLAKWVLIAFKSSKSGPNLAPKVMSLIKTHGSTKSPMKHPVQSTCYINIKTAACLWQPIKTCKKFKKIILSTTTSPKWHCEAIFLWHYKIIWSSNLVYNVTRATIYKKHCKLSWLVYFNSVKFSSTNERQFQIGYFFISKILTHTGCANEKIP